MVARPDRKVTGNRARPVQQVGRDAGRHASHGTEVEKEDHRLGTRKEGLDRKERKVGGSCRRTRGDRRAAPAKDQEHVLLRGRSQEEAVRNGIRAGHECQACFRSGTAEGKSVPSSPSTGERKGQFQQRAGGYPALEGRSMLRDRTAEQADLRHEGSVVEKRRNCF